MLKASQLKHIMMWCWKPFSLKGKGLWGRVGGGYNKIMIPHITRGLTWLLHFITASMWMGMGILTWRTV